MKKSVQDDYYKNKEGNDFFNRNFKSKDVPELRTGKISLLENIDQSNIRCSKVLEFGCCYGDLLYLLSKRDGVDEAYGVEASSDAVAFGKSLYGNDNVVFMHGTIADNDLMRSEFSEYFDLIIIDDVFGWVSRETILQSVTNIDYLLKDGGHILIRDFYPNKKIKSQNHHISDESIYNYKVSGSHAQVFLSTGIYEVEREKIFMDDIGISTSFKCANYYNYRWIDVILKKSKNDYFDIIEKMN